MFSRIIRFDVFMERFWRSLKYEALYLRQFETVSDLRRTIRHYVEFYNTQRFHQALNYKTPEEVYSGEIATNSMDLISCGFVENPSTYAKASVDEAGLHTIPQPLLRS
jgi:hypothetical protein